VAGVWRFLQRSTANQIISLPTNIEGVDELPRSVCQEARWLIGFWLNLASAAPVQPPLRVGMPPQLVGSGHQATDSVPSGVHPALADHRGRLHRRA